MLNGHTVVVTVVVVMICSTFSQFFDLVVVVVHAPFVPDPAPEVEAIKPELVPELEAVAFLTS